MSAEPIAAPKLTPVARLRSIIGGSAGNLVEWYDWYVYAGFALYFAPQFFPQGDRTAQLLGAAAVFGVGFLARPVGAWLMGLYADRKGRKAGLTLSVTLMAVGSLAIAVLPPAAVIGPIAPLLLLVFRLVQGLSLGGEYGASATYLSEMADRKNRGFWSSFHYVTLIAGQLSALGVLLLMQATMERADLEAWGWRIAFAIGGVLALGVFWLRRKLEETDSFRAAKAAGARPAASWRLVREHPREAAIVFALTAGGSLSFYAFTTYAQKYLVNTTGFTRETATEVAAGSLVVFMLLQPLAGWISDRIGRKPMLVGYGALMTLAAVPLMTLLGGAQSPWVAFGLLVCALTIQSAYTAISAVFKAELFPTEMRALGVALPYALANAIFGGSAEYVALWFKAEGMESGFFWYVAGMSAVFLIAALSLWDTGRRSRIQED